MRYLTMLLLALVFLLPSGAKATYADDAPLFSKQRVLVTAGLDYAKNDKSIGNNLNKAWEFKPSLNVAYNLGNYSSLVGAYSRGLKSDVDEYRVGVRIRLFDGSK